MINNLKPVHLSDKRYFCFQCRILELLISNVEMQQLLQQSSARKITKNQKKKKKSTFTIIIIIIIICLPF